MTRTLLIAALAALPLTLHAQADYSRWFTDRTMRVDYFHTGTKNEERMTLDLTCQACDTSFELDVTELLDEPRIQCPSCDARAPTAVAEGLSNALEELLGHASRLRSRFQTVFELDSDDLPPPFDRERTRADDDAVEDEAEDDEVERDDEELGRDAED